MKLINISMMGTKPVHAVTLHSKAYAQKYYSVVHGQVGKGTWRIKLPLPPNEFPVEGPEPLGLEDTEFDLINLGKKDYRNQDRYILARSRLPSNDYLALLHLNPGWESSANYLVKGKAKVICCGSEHGAECPVVHVTGPCSIVIKREGGLMGTPCRVDIRYDGEQWHFDRGVEGLTLKQRRL